MTEKRHLQEALGFWHFLGNIGVSPVQAQAKACACQILTFKNYRQSIPLCLTLN
jgi:hypothetical protein